MKFSKVVFLIAGIYGLLALVPQYFLETATGQQNPPPITHPEFYYGFIGCAVAWQIAFLVVSRDPVQYRPLMLAAIFEKLSFGVAVIILYLNHRTAGVILAGGSIDLLLAVFFTLSYVKTPATRTDGLDFDATRIGDEV